MEVEDKVISNPNASLNVLVPRCSKQRPNIASMECAVLQVAPYNCDGALENNGSKMTMQRKATKPIS